jgi:carboxymethylenebutenolidase
MSLMPYTTATTSDGPMGIFVSEPSVSAKGVVIVIQEAFGITSHIESVAERLASEGYIGICPALFHRQGSPVFAYDDLDPVMKAIGQLTGEGIVIDVNAAIDFAGAQGFSKEQIGTVGFCMGGSVTFLAATQGRLGAAVSFYGGGLAAGRFGFPPLIELAASLKSPWLGFFGDLDQGIPIEDVEALRIAVADASVDTEVQRYTDADHGFHCDDRPWVYNEDAAKDAWSKAIAWFDTHLGD